jgi:hypothetical protein
MVAFWGAFQEKYKNICIFLEIRGFCKAHCRYPNLKNMKERFK